MNSKKNAKFKCYFHEIWLDNPEFSSWFRKDKSKTQTSCRLWLKSFYVVSRRQRSLTLYASGEKHKSRMPSDTQNMLTTFVAASEVKDSKTDD